MADLPTGTVTFVFTDLEDSTRLWDEHPEAMKASLARHDVILREAVSAHAGSVVKTTGDGMLAAFPTAHDAVTAALAAQRTLSGESWDQTGPLRVRMGLHTGAAEFRDGDYFGPAVNRAARLMAAGHGGQVLVSRVTEELVGNQLPEEASFVGLGEYRLRGLERPEAVFQLVHPDLAVEFPRLRSLDSVPGNLPMPVSSFVGREVEISRVGDALDQARVVTLTGVGGVGKTRLALRAAAELWTGYRDGAWFCELAPTRRPEDVADAILEMFGVQVRQAKTATEALLEFLGAKELLLVLDNCEHVLKPVADLVAALGRACPRVVVLATSREGLSVAGEHILGVPSLDVPDAESDFEVLQRSDAVMLFVERAKAVKPDFLLSATNAEAVAQLCRRLDGVALAIELAAARVPMLTPAELTHRLDQRFRVLTGGERNAVERHQTLRAAIDWSYDLLADRARQVLDRLSVFVGGFTLEAAEAVTLGDTLEADDVLELLAGLVAQSLVVAESDGSETRYRLLETIRQYGQEHLDALDQAQQFRHAHASYYAGYLEAGATEVNGSREIEWVARLTRELDNIRAALSWAIDNQDVDIALRIVGACDGANMYHTDVGTRLRPLAPATLGLPGATDHVKFPAALVQAAWNAHDLGDQELAASYSDQALAAEERLGTEASAYLWIARAAIAGFAGRLDEFTEHMTTAAVVARARGDTVHLAWTLALQAQSGVWTGDATDAIGEAEAALQLARRVENPSAIANALGVLGSVLSDTDPERALTYLRESLECSAPLGTISAGLNPLIAADVAARVGNQHEAAELCEKAIDAWHWAGMRSYLGFGLMGTAMGLLTIFEPEAAATLRGAGEAFAGGLGVGFMGEERYREFIAALDETLGEARRLELHRQGAAMNEDEAVAYAHTVIRRVLDQEQPTERR